MDTKRHRRAAALIFLLTTAAAARAQETPPAALPADSEARLAYEAGFYAQYTPRTALDMVNRTPGFVLSEGAAERRGFSGAVGNVLIDGQRPIAKSQTLADILQRIPAAQVVRIELLRGGGAAGDASGFAVLANVVRTHASGGGAWQLGTEYAGRDPVPNGWAAWSGRMGTTDYSLGANGYSLLREERGSRVIADGAGAVTSTRRDVSPRSFYEIAVNGEVGRVMFGGRTQLTGQVYRSRYQEDTRIGTYSPDGAFVDDEFNPYSEGKWTFEGGLSHERGLGPWSLTLNGLITRTRFESDISSTRSDTVGTVTSVFTQDIARKSGETILRATLDRELSSRHRIETSVEGALNAQDQQLSLTFDSGGGPFPIPVPNSNLAVREHRGDAYIAHTWTPAPRWSVEMRLAGEISRLSFTGDTDQSVDLAYFKPAIRITRELGRSDQLRLRIYRDVDQLDFTDFVSSASLSDNIIDGGNPDLRPETSWRIEATADLHFGTKGAASLTLFRHWLSGAVDLIPVGSPGARFDAPGNIGAGDVWGVEFDLELPLQPVISGGTFTLDSKWARSRVTDPVTGDRRSASDFEDLKLKVEFRQDLPKHKFSWGSSYAPKPELVSYRLGEIDRRRAHPLFDLWAETSVIEGYKFRMTITSLLSVPKRRQRTFFEPDRNGEVMRTERSERHPGHELIFTVSGNL
jgi:hypothetical protein